MAKDKKTGGGAPMRAPALTDPRFSRLHTDPRFLRPKKEDTKVVVDDRFKDLLQGGANGKPKRKTDKFGRKIAKGESEVDQMRRFYRLDEDGEEDKEDEDQDAEEEVVDYARGEGDLDSSSDEDSSEQDDSDSEDESSSDDDEDVMIGSSKVLDRERKRAAALSDDDDGYGDDIGEIDLDEDEAEDVYAKLDAQAQRAIESGEGIEGADSADEAETSKRGKGKAKSKKSGKTRQEKIPTGDDSARLAVVNMDWDHVRSKDLYKVFSSLVSPTGSVSSTKKIGAHGSAITQVRGKLLHVRIYPSDFGKERMAKEDVEGPPRDIFKKKSGDDDDDEEINEKTIIQVDEGGEFDEEALRKYQLERLRYYYAVATFDSKETARHVYNEIDGTEMERTANVFDLRFIPDGMEFPDGEDGRDAEFRDQATEDVTNYKGVDFRTDALRHSKVKLTWDQDDPERSKLTRMVSRGGLTKEQLRDDDFKAYLASATESEGEDDDDEEANAAGRDRLRALLNLDDAPKGRGKRNGGVFDDGNDEDEQGDMEITFMPGLSEAAGRKSRGEKKADSEDETTLDKYKRKLKEKKEKRKSKKAEADSDQEEEAPAEGAADAGFDDPFFASDNDMDMEAAMAAELGEEAPKPKKAGKKDKKSKQQQPDLDPEEAARQRAELQLLVGDESDDERTRDGRQHFDLKDIIRAESGKDAKKAKMLRRLSKKKQRQEEEFQARKGKPLVQDEFEIDTKDQRFSAVLEDHRFAIDPSHPGFVKTNAMQQLMQERRRQDESNPESGKASEKKEQKAGDDDIASLVNKLKRRSGDQVSQPKEKKNKA